MNVTFLGTGTSQGVPVIGCDCEVCSSVDFRDKRLRTSVHIEVDGKSLIIDSGPDFRQQVLTARIKRLNALLFTHQHKDHTAGMDDIRSFNFRQKIDMPIYGTRDVIAQLKREFSYIFEAKQYPGVPKVAINEIGLSPFSIEGISIIPIEVMHYKLPVMGYRINDFTYITDANYISEKEIKKIQGSKVLVLNALQIEKHISHFNLEEALEMVEKIQPEQAYFTHISHKLGTHQKTALKLPDHVSLAWDGLTIRL